MDILRIYGILEYSLTAFTYLCSFLFCFFALYVYLYEVNIKHAKIYVFYDNDVMFDHTKYCNFSFIKDEIYLPKIKHTKANHGNLKMN